jgi:hypothetical protein
VISFVCSDHTRKRIARATEGPQTILCAKPSTKIYIWTALRKSTTRLWSKYVYAMPPSRQSSLVLMDNGTTPILAHRRNVVSRQSGRRRKHRSTSRLVACPTAHRGRQKITFRARVPSHVRGEPGRIPPGRFLGRRGHGRNGVPIARVKTPPPGAALDPPGRVFHRDRPEISLRRKRRRPRVRVHVQAYSTSPRADRSSGTPALG